MHVFEYKNQIHVTGKIECFLKMRLYKIDVFFFHSNLQNKTDHCLIILLELKKKF